jgi:predicted ribosomally synthesized peptide with SipW-like signal peptide
VRVGNENTPLTSPKGGLEDVKKFLILALAIVLALGMIGSAFAYFTDTATSSGNTFSAGTLDLKIKESGSGVWQDGITIPVWHMEDMVPGVSYDYGAIGLKEFGSIVADHLVITCSYTCTEGPPTGGMDTVDQDNPLYWDDFARYMIITSLVYKDSTWQIVYDGTSWSIIGAPPYPPGYTAGDWEVNYTTDGVSGVSLADLKNDPLDNLPPPEGLLEPEFDMTLMFSSDAGNDLQGDTLDLTMIFTLNQDASQ